MKDEVASLLMVVAVGCAVVMTVLVARRELRGTVLPSDSAREVSNWRSYTVGAHTTGPQDAPIVMVEFFDFQCPACREMSYAIDSVLNQHKESLRLIRRHFPIRAIHPRAYSLAIGAICAERQGMFNDYYRAAFEHQTATALPDWQGPATFLLPDADTVAFRQCMQDTTAAGFMDRDLVAGQMMGLRATPTILINGRLYQGARSAAALTSLLPRAR